MAGSEDRKAAQRTKSRISLNDFASKVRAGMTDAELMRVYSLSPSSLAACLKKLVEAVVSQQCALDSRRSAEIQQFHASRQCGGRGSSMESDSGECPRCGLIMGNSSQNDAPSSPEELKELDAPNQPSANEALQRMSAFERFWGSRRLAKRRKNSREPSALKSRRL